MSIGNYISKHFSRLAIVFLFLYVACTPKTDAYDPSIGLYGTKWIEEQRKDKEIIDYNFIYIKPDENLNLKFFKNRIDPREFAKRFVSTRAKSLFDAFQNPEPEKGRAVFAYSLYRPFLAVAAKKIGIDYSEYDRGVDYTSQEDLERIYDYIRQNLDEKNSFCNFGRLFFNEIKKVEIKPYSVEDRVLDPKSKSYSIQTQYDIKYYLGQAKGLEDLDWIRFRVYFLIQGDHVMQTSIIDAYPAECLYELD
ncbi:hypothetical protein EHR02_12920 [Leptospira levettii]|uniref:hypothetical protein n=1 Tax=Leptospira levettii TaxID=2023178 RepID=UPI00108405D9|nr:hypothetical protein [Leptospira levettii]TGM93622.1 hypothetical protein EHR02_12920 [Leptospira levettii]